MAPPKKPWAETWRGKREMEKEKNRLKKEAKQREAQEQKELNA